MKKIHTGSFSPIAAVLIASLLASAGVSRADGLTPAVQPVNKLLYMYRFYYLPFSLEFQEGRTVNDILPFFPGENKSALKLLQAEELETLDGEWNKIKASWRQKSLFLATPVPTGQTRRISQHLASHVIPLSRGAFDTLPINDRIMLANALRTKSPQVQAAFTQLRFLKSFLGPQDDGKFNFFVIGASWCESSREYRILFETYFKEFPNSDVNLHSVVIDDPKEQIFDSRILRELFPNPARYSHNNLPRFLAIETVNGTTTIYEEGEALQQLYDRFFYMHRGYLDSKVTIFRNNRARGASDVDPLLSSISK
jgi:thiol-disulfide isomerase/thioredoxin